MKMIQLRSGLRFLHKLSSREFHCSPLSSTKLYSSKHEWVEVQGDSDKVKVGITKYAAEALGDVVFAQLPSAGQEVSVGEECGAVESVKAASDIYSPVSGKVVQSNPALESRPNIINSSPELEAWMFELTLSNRIELRSLMDKDGYDNFLKSVTEDLE